MMTATQSGGEAAAKHVPKVPNEAPSFSLILSAVLDSNTRSQDQSGVAFVPQADWQTAGRCKTPSLAQAACTLRRGSPSGQDWGRATGSPEPEGVGDSAGRYGGVADGREPEWRLLEIATFQAPCHAVLRAGRGAIPACRPSSDCAGRQAEGGSGGVDHQLPRSAGLHRHRGWPDDEVQETTIPPGMEFVGLALLGPTALVVIGAFFFLAGLFAPLEMAHEGLGDSCAIGCSGWGCPGWPSCC
jgi:hypothetical protein